MELLAREASRVCKANKALLELWARLVLAALSDLLGLKAGRGETETEVRRVLGAKMVTQGGAARWGRPETRVRAAYKARR